MPVTISIAESNPLVLSGLSEMLARDRRFSVVATSATAEGFIGIVIRVPVDVVIVDWKIPTMGGHRLLEVLRDQENAPRIIVYGEQGDTVLRQALQAGAAGFCDRKGAVENLLDVCSAVSEGKMVFPYMDLRQIDHNPLNSLTKRELQLLEALSSGSTNKELAEQFSISANTVKYHLTNLYTKLGANNRAKAVAMYLTLSTDFHAVSQT